MASQTVAGNLSLGRLEKGVFRLLCFAGEILLFKWVWKGFEKSLCVCVQQGAEPAHFNSQFRLCLGVALTTPKTKGACVCNLLLGCFLLLVVSGPAITVTAHGLVCVRGTELEILKNCSLYPQTMWIPGGLTEKGPHRRLGQELHLTRVALMDSGTSETCKPVLSFPAIIFTV